MMGLKGKTDTEIDAWISNHERLGKTQSELYLALIEERNLRHGHGLSISKSIEAMIAAAKENRFISYGELADANGMEWAKARHRMNGKHGHLDDLLAYCHSKGMPLLTAIVVQKGKLDSGSMDQFTLDGFVEGVQRLGVAVADPDSFLKRCQQECFEWAAAAVSSS
jgi:5-methylcytosine-specific restriction protein B